MPSVKVMHSVLSLLCSLSPLCHARRKEGTPSHPGGLHFEAKRLALHSVRLQSELCLWVELVCLPGSTAQKYSSGDCLLHDPGKPTPINCEPEAACVITVA